MRAGYGPLRRTAIGARRDDDAGRLRPAEEDRNWGEARRRCGPVRPAAGAPPACGGGAGNWARRDDDAGRLRPAVGPSRSRGRGRHRGEAVNITLYAGAVTVRPPATVRRAGFIVAAEGAAGLVVAAILVIRGLAGADQRVVNGLGTSVWFLL